MSNPVFVFINKFPQDQESNRSNLNTKRSLLFIIGAGVVSSAFAHFSSSTPPKQKGPLVLLDMDQAELDVSFNQSYTPIIRQIRSRHALNSDITRSRLGNPKRFAY
jgi:arylformamidase